MQCKTSLFFNQLLTMRRIALLFFLMSLALLAPGQPLSGDSLQLDPVTVTAGLRPAQSSRTGRNIQVMKGDMFTQLPVNNIDELLRYIPGVEVQSRGPMGTQADISIRGGTFQQVLVILDGMRLNDPNTGHFSAYIPIAPAEIERIEVLKGPASAIYGTEAVGGVIHIITKSFAQKTGQSANASVIIGEHDLLNAQAGFSYGNGKNFLSGGLLTNHSKGQPQRGTRGYFDMSTASLSFVSNINKNWYAGIRSAYDYRDFSAQNFYTTFASDTANERVKTFWNQAQLGYRKNNFNWNLYAGYKRLNDRFQFNSGLSPNDNTSKLTQLLTTANWAASQKSNFVMGLQWLNKKIESNDRGNHKVNQVGAFGVWQYEAAKGLLLSPALRLEYNERSGMELVPQLTTSYRAGKWQLRGAAGRTLRDADFTERYNNYNRTMVRSGSIGNPDLLAESSFSYEVGADYYASNAFRVGVTYFDRLQNRVIDFVPTAYADMPRQENLVPGGQYALASNVAETNVSGLEADINFNKQWSKNLLQLGVGIVWLNTDVREGTPGFYLSSHAKFLANFYSRLTVGRLSLSFTGVYKIRDERAAAAIGARVNEQYFVWNGSVQGRILPWLSAFVQIDNAGDATYSDLLGSVMPRRWTMGGIKVNWQK